MTQRDDTERLRPKKLDTPRPMEPGEGAHAVAIDAAPPIGPLKVDDSPANEAPPAPTVPIRPKSPASARIEVVNHSLGPIPEIGIAGEVIAASEAVEPI